MIHALAQLYSAQKAQERHVSCSIPEPIRVLIDRVSPSWQKAQLERLYLNGALREAEHPNTNLTTIEKDILSFKSLDFYEVTDALVQFNAIIYANDLAANDNEKTFFSILNIPPEADVRQKIEAIRLFAPSYGSVLETIRAILKASCESKQPITKQEKAALVELKKALPYPTYTLRARVAHKDLQTEDSYSYLKTYLDFFSRREKLSKKIQSIYFTAMVENTVAPLHLFPNLQRFALKGRGEKVNLSALQACKKITNMQFYGLPNLLNFGQLPRIETLQKLEVMMCWKINSLTWREDPNDDTSVKSLHEQFPHLERLNLDGTTITDFTPLENCTLLESLKIGGDSVTSLRGIGKIQALKTLRISHPTNLDTLEGIAPPVGQASSLKTLTIVGGRYHNLKELHNLSLETLSLQYVRITQFPTEDLGLKNLSLEDYTLDNSLLNKIEAMITAQKSLTDLTISGSCCLLPPAKQTGLYRCLKKASLWVHEESDDANTRFDFTFTTNSQEKIRKIFKRSIHKG